jgi:hypothetical protein
MPLLFGTSRDHSLSIRNARASERKRLVTTVGLGGQRHLPGVDQPQQDLVPKALPAHPAGSLYHGVSLVGSEVVTPNMRILVSRGSFAHSSKPLICAAGEIRFGGIILDNGQGPYISMRDVPVVRRHVPGVKPVARAFVR